MKKYLIFITILLSAYGVYGQEDSSVPGESSDFPKSTFHINPLGLLQFGPIFMYESRLGTGSTYLAPYFRFGYLGVITHLQWDADYVDPLNLGFGMMVKVYSSTNQGNALYYGGGLEYYIGRADYDVDTSFETYEEFIGLPVLFNFGHRWRYSSGKFVNLGIIAGAVLTIRDEEFLASDGSLVATYDETLFIAMLEFSFGWGKN